MDPQRIMHQDEGGEIDPTQAIDWTPSFGLCSNRGCTTRTTTPVGPGVTSVSPSPLNRINTNRSPLILNPTTINRGGVMCNPRVAQAIQARIGLVVRSANTASIQQAPNLDGPRLQSPRSEQTFGRNYPRYNNQQQHQQTQLQPQQQQQQYHHHQLQQQQVNQSFISNIPNSSYIQSSQYSNLSPQERTQISQLSQQLIQDCSYNPPATQVQPSPIQIDYHQGNLLPQQSYQSNQMPQCQIHDYQQPRRPVQTQPANTMANNLQPNNAPMLTQQLLQTFNPSQGFSSQTVQPNRPNLSFHPTPPIQTQSTHSNRGRRRTAPATREPASNELRGNNSNATYNTRPTENRLLKTPPSIVPANQQTQVGVEQQTVSVANINASQQQIQSTPVSVSSTTRSSNEQQSRANTETNTTVEKCNKACQVDIRPIMINKSLMVCSSVVDQGCQTDPIVDGPKEKKVFVDQATMPIFSPMLVRFKTTPKRRKLNHPSNHDQSDDEIDVTR